VELGEQRQLYKFRRGKLAVLRWIMAFLLGSPLAEGQRNLREQILQ
jgi:hypothetical protein